MANLVIEAMEELTPGQIIIGFSDGDGNFHADARALVIRQTTRAAWQDQPSNRYPSFHPDSFFFEVAMD
jgi:hypothetical protein